MKLIDFDQKFFEYAQGWIAMRPGLTEKQIDDSYNQMMLDWLNAPAKWLEGATPGTYFCRFTDPRELVDMVAAYVKGGVGVPEPLYNRIVGMGDACVPDLIHVFSREKNPEELRSTALGMLVDIDGELPLSACLDVVSRAVDGTDELANMAVELLSRKGEKMVQEMLSRYPGMTRMGQTLILDVLCNFPGDERIYTNILERLLSDPEDRALYASYLGKLGDERAVEPMRELLEKQDIRYLDYVELRNAVEQLGGDAGPDRAFYGDPDFEAMRNM